MEHGTGSRTRGPLCRRLKGRSTVAGRLDAAPRGVSRQRLPEGSGQEVQEAVIPAPPAAARLGYMQVAAATLSGTDACTAVLVRGLGAEPIEARPAMDNSLIAGARVSTVHGALVVQSVHVSTGPRQRAALQLVADELPGAFDPLPVVVGGDFNAARLFRGGKLYGWFFEAMAASGLHEPHWAIHGREVQSFWGPRTTKPYQDDHFFTSPDLASRVTACRVIDDEVVRRVSDHGPVELELE